MSKDDLPKRLRADANGKHDGYVADETAAVLREAAREIILLRKVLTEARGWLDDTIDNAKLNATIRRVDAALGRDPSGRPRG